VEQKPAHLVMVEYDPRWPTLFAAERDRLVTVLDVSAESIHHVGSTAVPGLAAKPVIDIMAVLPVLPTSAQIAAMQHLGYEHLGENGISGRAYFRRGQPRQYQVHVFPEGHHAVVEHLRFRDILRSDPGTRAEYERVKRNAALAAPTMQAYVDAKGPFIRATLDGRG